MSLRYSLDNPGETAHRRRPLLRALFLFAALAAPALAAAQEVIPLSEVRPGMRGRGRTVFSGSKVEGFDVDVIAVWRGMEMNRNLILVRCSGGSLEKTGIVAGMSGSPVYIGNRLMGALSAGWALAKEPVGGVTPIAEMLALLDKKRPPGGGGNSPNSPGASLSPIATPLYFSGFHPKAMEAMKSRFEQLGMVPMSGGGVMGAAGPQAAPPLEPGSALSASLVEGDMSLSAIGTLTWRQGDRVLAFGHAFLDAGPISIPMAPAVVHTILANYLVSFKIGNPLAPVGVLELDYPSGVLGRIGPKAGMIDTRFLVRQEGSADSSRRVQIAKHRQLTPMLLAMSAGSAVLGVSRAAGPVTIRSKFDVELEDGKKIAFSGAAVSDTSPNDALMHLLEPLLVLFENPFQSVMPAALKMEFEVQLANRSALLDGVRINKSRFRPGESVEVTASLRPFDGKPVSRTVSFPLPRGLEAAQAVLEVIDARGAAQREKARNPSKYAPKDLSSLTALLAGTRTETSLYVRLSLPREGVALAGRELPSLPGSLLALFSGPGATGTSKLASDLEIELPTGFVVFGQEALSIEILPESER